MLRTLGSGLAIILVASTASHSSAAPKSVTGTIRTYECGDNCYLTIRTKARKDIMGLCVAKACRPWNERTAIPKRLVGKAVRVTIGRGQQYDGSGNVMGDFPAFTKIEFVH